jgi:prevent-host-death family protein
MARVPKIVPVTDLRQDAASVIREAQESDEPVVITQRGRAAAVLLGIDAYERTQHDRELLRRLALGEKEIARGEGHSLHSVLREADALLEDDER